MPKPSKHTIVRKLNVLFWFNSSIHVTILVRFGLFSIMALGRSARIVGRFLFWFLACRCREGLLRKPVKAARRAKHKSVLIYAPPEQI